MANEIIAATTSNHSKAEKEEEEEENLMFQISKIALHSVNSYITH